MRPGLLGLVLAAAIGLAACDTTRLPSPAPRTGEAVYSSIFPNYAEFCALSQIQKKPGFGADLRGGPGGHSVLYLNGVCRVGKAGYPTIELCDPKAGDAAQGVGLSVNDHYRNANWVAVPGRDFLFHGDLAPGEPVTRAAYRRTQARAEAMGILDGVEFHARFFDDKPAGMSRRDWMYELSIGTDYATGFARDRYCARVPLQRAQMARIVGFLNQVNAPYRAGKQEFEWDVLQNNCTHLTHNALAAAGVWRDWEVEQFFLFAAFDFPVPKNEFVNLLRRTNDLPLDDPLALYRDRAAREALLQEDWLPTEPGALVDAEHAVQDNRIYDTDLALIFYDDPPFGPYQGRFRRIFSEPRYYEIGANLRYFRTLYDRILRERRPLAAYLDRQNTTTPKERQDFAAFYDRFNRYILRSRGRVRAELAALGPAAMPAQPAGKPLQGATPAAAPSTSRGG